MVSSRHSKPERIGNLLRERVQALGWERRLREEEVLTGWDAAVGSQIAAHARPSHIDNRRLTIVTESPVWTQQLTMMAPELLRRVCRHFGPEAVTGLYFVTGELPRPQAPEQQTPRPGPAPRIPPPLECELAAIPDEGIRESVRRLILASLAVDGPGGSGDAAPR